MIKYIHNRDLLADDAEALVNAVNCKGSMGKGVALAFRRQYPDILEPYRQACEAGDLRPGRLVCLSRLPSRPAIVLFPTKDHWRGKSKLEWVKQGLMDLRENLPKWGFASIAMPALGCGHGGLSWSRVKPLIEEYLGASSVEVRVYAPSDLSVATGAEECRRRITP